MCRGWFIGVALGVIDRKTNEPIVIGRPNDTPASFPYPALSSTADLRDQLAVVLESLALAYVLVSQERSLGPLEAYQRLRDLGADANGSTGTSTFELVAGEVMISIVDFKRRGSRSDRYTLRRATARLIEWIRSLRCCRRLEPVTAMSTKA